MNDKVTEAAARIKLLISDVDGVLTDGGRYYTKNGEVEKKFDNRDGMGVNVLLRNKIKTVIVTKETSQIVKKWAKEMNITHVFNGVVKKESILFKICKNFKVSPQEIAYIGDDINDLELMKKVGFSGLQFQVHKLRLWLIINVFRILFNIIVKSILVR